VAREMLVACSLWRVGSLSSLGSWGSLGSLGSLSSWGLLGSLGSWSSGKNDGTWHVACGAWERDRRQLVACGVAGPMTSVFPTSHMLVRFSYGLRATCPAARSLWGSLGYRRAMKSS
jgi:hypothetical protein